MMKAIVQDRYGSVDVLLLAEVAKPAVGAGEVPVRVRAASVHADVWQTQKPHSRHGYGGHRRICRYRRFTPDQL
jgi:NADPH:quinone reductase-like Zn-dependent oxidoreductase